MRKLLLILAVFFLALPPDASADSLAVGGKRYLYDVPAGFVRADEASFQAIDSIFAAILPQGVELVEVLLSQADYDAIQNGTLKMLQDYIAFTDIKMMGSFDWEQAMFDAYKAQYTQNSEATKQMAQAMVTGKIREFSGQDIELALSQLLVLDEQDDLVTIGTKSTLVDSGNTVSVYTIFTSLLLNKRLLYIYHFKTVDDDEEIAEFIGSYHNVFDSLNIRPQ